MVRRIFCLLAVLAIAGIAKADLLAYYDFTDAGGNPSTANEGTVGTAADGVLMNGATIVDLDPDPRSVEHVLKLDYGDGTVHQYMNCGMEWANWDPIGLEPLTIAAWIYVTPGTWGDWRNIISKGYEQSWALVTGSQPNPDDDKIAFSAHRAVAAWSPITGTINVRDGWWHHVAGVVGAQSGTAKLYIDGVLQGTAGVLMPVWENDEHVLVGDDPIKAAQGWDFQWNGMLDDIRVYDEALSEQDVQDLYYGSCRFYTAVPLWLGIHGPEEAAESSQVQYTATAYMWHCGFIPFWFPVDVTEEAIWWVEPGTYASIDGSGLLTTGNIDTCQDITVYAQYTLTLPANSTVEAEKVVVLYTVDLNDDGKIDLGDYAILARQWLEAPGEPSADIAPFCGGDGIVGIDDLGLLVDDWLWEHP